MPVAASHADKFLDWQLLLSTCEEFAEALPSTGPLQAELAEALRRAMALLDDQQHYATLRREATKQLRLAEKTAHEAARRLRSAAKAGLGTDAELLVKFKVAPRRELGPRKRKAEQANPGEGAPAPEEPAKE